LIQVYRKAVQDEGIDVLSDPSEFDNWIKAIFDCVQENLIIAEAPENIDHIRIMSLHSSKGLSAKFVILCSMIDQLVGAVDQEIEPEFAPYHVEEQRRLFYVAITRCKSSSDNPGRLIISSFLSIYGIDALKMGIPTQKPKAYLDVLSTRFIKDFGLTSPQPVIGGSIS
jgi:DNA helicase II / ATP-dependent DNA helicase PcrA